MSVLGNKTCWVNMEYGPCGLPSSTHEWGFCKQHAKEDAEIMAWLAAAPESTRKAFADAVDEAWRKTAS